MRVEGGAGGAPAEGGEAVRGRCTRCAQPSGGGRKSAAIGVATVGLAKAQRRRRMRVCRGQAFTLCEVDAMTRR